jgi:low temperature requirement protein LtrA
MVFLGVGFRFQEGQNSRPYMAWYVVSAAETVGNVALSLRYKTLSFDGTHLTQRLTVLTLIIIGERVISVATSVSLIVQNEGWSKSRPHIFSAIAS